MHPDPRDLHPDELADQWRKPRALDAKPLSLRARIAVAVAALLIVAFIVGAFLEGLARAEAMPTACDGLTRSDCRALLAEGGAQ